MELKGFKELLLLKADDETIKTLINFAQEDFLIDKIMEALEKMAKPTATKGQVANSPIQHFGGSFTEQDLEMMRDALGHHLSHYKAALKAGNRKVADQHLHKIIPLMNLAAKASAHSRAFPFVLDYPKLEPWETNYTGHHRFPTDVPVDANGKVTVKDPVTDAMRTGEPGKLFEGTKGLNRKVAPNSRGGRGVANYHYLEMPAHGGHSHTEKLAKPESGYPFEEIRLGIPQDIDSGKGHLPIDDVEHKGEFVPHPFDQHPIHQFTYHTQGNVKPEDEAAYHKAHSDWVHSTVHEDWLKDYGDRFSAKPDVYSGEKKPGHFFEGVPLQESPRAKDLQPQTPAAASPAPEVKETAPVAQPPVETKKPSEAINPDLIPDALKHMLPGANKPKKSE